MRQRLTEFNVTSLEKAPSSRFLAVTSHRSIGNPSPLCRRLTRDTAQVVPVTRSNAGLPIHTTRKTKPISFLKGSKIHTKVTELGRNCWEATSIPEEGATPIIAKTPPRQEYKVLCTSGTYCTEVQSSPQQCSGTAVPAPCPRRPFSCWSHSILPPTLPPPVTAAKSLQDWRRSAPAAPPPFHSNTNT